MKILDRRIQVKNLSPLLIVLFWSVSCFAQTDPIDSLWLAIERSEKDSNRVDLLNELAWTLAVSDAETSIILAKKAIQLSEEMGYTEGQSVGHNYLGHAYGILGNQKRSIEEVQKSFALDSAANKQLGMAISHNQLGNSYQSIGEYDQAIYHLYASLRLMEELGHDYNAARIKLNVADFHCEQHDYSKAVQFGNEALSVFIEYEDNIMIALATEILAIAHQRQKNWEQSLRLYHTSLALFKEAGDLYNLADTYNNLGIYYYQKSVLDSALYYHKKSLALDASLGIKEGQAVSYANMALVYAAQEENEKAEFYIQKSIATGKEAKSLQRTMETIKYVADIYYEDEQYKKAYEHRLIYEEMKDSVFSIHKQEQILTIQEEYQSEKKAKEITKLKHERDAAELKSQLTDTIIYLSTGIILLLVVVIVFMFRHRKIKEKEQRIELEQKVLRSQMNPHFIFNSLNSIQRIFLEGQVGQAIDYISDFGNLLRIILENSRKEKITIQNEIETLKLYLEIEMIRLKGQIDYSFDIDSSLDLLNNHIPPLIIQPFVENAIWHGILPKPEPGGKIEIKLERKSTKALLCTITDNGIGINTSLEKKRSAASNSKGMSITQERLGASNPIEAIELTEGGTKVKLRIPIT